MGVKGYPFDSLSVPFIERIQGMIRLGLKLGPVDWGVDTRMSKTLGRRRLYTSYLYLLITLRGPPNVYKLFTGLIVSSLSIRRFFSKGFRETLPIKIHLNLPGVTGL